MSPAMFIVFVLLVTIGGMLLMIRIMIGQLRNIIRIIRDRKQKKNKAKRSWPT